MRARDIIDEAIDPKRVLRTLRPKIHTIHHDWARWTTDEHGRVLSYKRAVEFPDYAQVDDEDRNMMSEFAQIWAFDLREIEKYWAEPAPEGIDISDIGYWTRDGQYHPPDERYRQDIKTGGIRR